MSIKIPNRLVCRQQSIPLNHIQWNSLPFMQQQKYNCNEYFTHNFFFCLIEKKQQIQQKYKNKIDGVLKVPYLSERMTTIAIDITCISD